MRSFIFIGIILITIGLVFWIIAGGDDSLFFLVLNFRENWLTVILVPLTYLSNWQFILPASFLIGAVLAFRGNKRKFIFFTAPVLMGEVIYQSLKLIIGRSRPDEALALIEDIGYSFPSGHATMSVIFYGVLICFFLRYLQKPIWRRAAMVAFGFFVFLTGFSRIYVGLHWPSDIIAGWVLGFTILVLTLKFWPLALSKIPVYTSFHAPLKAERESS